MIVRETVATSTKEVAKYGHEHDSEATVYELYEDGTEVEI